VGEDAVELDHLRGDVEQLGLLRVVGGLGGGDEQAKHKGGHGGDDAEHELQHLARVRAEVVGREEAAEQQAQAGGRADDAERPGGGGERAHGRLHDASDATAMVPASAVLVSVPAPPRGDVLCS
jgi:hypothetical protein